MTSRARATGRARRGVTSGGATRAAHGRRSGGGTIDRWRRVIEGWTERCVELAWSDDLTELMIDETSVLMCPDD